MPARDNEKRCLTEALGAFPLVQLVSKDLVSGFLELTDIDLSSPSQDIDHRTDSTLENPVDVSEIVRGLDNTSLDEIVFKRPIGVSNSEKDVSVDLELSEVEQKIFTEVAEKFANKVVTETEYHIDSAEVDNAAKETSSLSESAESFLKQLRNGQANAKRPASVEIVHKKKRKLPSTSIKSEITTALSHLVDISEQIQSQSAGTDMWIDSGDDKLVLSLPTLKKIEGILVKVDSQIQAASLDHELVKCIIEECKKIILDQSTINWSNIKKGIPHDIQAHSSTLISRLHCFKIILYLGIFYEGGVNFLREEVLTSLIDFANQLLQSVVLGSCTLTRGAAGDDIDSIHPINTQIVNSLTSLFQVITTFINYYPMDQLVALVANANLVLAEFPLDAVSHGAFESFKVQCADFMATVSRNIPESRSYLIHEILQEALKKHPNKSQLNSYTLPTGETVWIVTSLLVKLCQNEDLKDLSDKFKQLTSNSQGGLSDSQVVKIGRDIESIIFEADSSAKDIISVIFQKTIDSTDKNWIDSIVTDLLKLMNVVEFSYAERFLGFMLSFMMSKVKKTSLTPAQDIILIDQCGKIASKIESSKPKAFYSISDNSLISDIINHRRVLHRLFVSAKSKRSHKDKSRFLIIKTIEEILNMHKKKEGQISHMNEGETRLTEVDKMAMKYLRYLLEILLGENVQQFPKPDQKPNYQQIAFSSLLLDTLERFGDFLMTLSKSTKVKVRSKCIRLLSDFADSDSGVLKYNWVQKIMTEMLTDSSPVVRDSVLELIQKYLDKNALLVDAFQGPLSSSLSDDSLLVRKRVLKLLKLIYQATNSRDTRISIVSKLIARCDDEDDETMVSAIRQMIIEIWFKNISVYTTNLEIAEIIIGVANSSPKIRTSLLAFLKREISSSQEPSVVENYKKILDETIDHISLNIDSSDERESRDLLKLIALFTESDGKLLTQQHLVSFQSFLTEGKSANDSISYPTLQIFRSTIPNIKVLNPVFVESTISYLLTGLTKFSSRELHEAIPCVWHLCSRTGNTQKLASAAISAMRMTSVLIDSSHLKRAKSEEVKLSKLIELLGCFGAYCKFEGDRKTFLDASVGLKEKESIVSLIAKFIIVFCNDSQSSDIRIIAVKNLLVICTSHPKLLVSPAVLSILDKSLDDEDDKSKITVINGIIRFVNAQEEEALKKVGTKEVSSQNTKFDKDAFLGEGKSYVNDGICTAITQRFLPKALEMCLQNPDFSVYPVQFVTLALRSGLGNPKACMPYIIALHSSSNNFIRKSSMQLHKSLLDKFESLADSSYPEALKLAIRYRTDVSDDMFLETYFLRLVYSIVSKNLNSRRKFIQAIAKMIHLNHKDTLEQAINNRDAILYIVLNLGQIDFLTLEEVVVLLSSLHKVLSRDAMDLNDLLQKPIKGRKKSLETIQTYCMKCEILLIFLFLWNHLMTKYDIMTDDVLSYVPGKVDLELRLPPRLRHTMMLEFDFSVIDVNVSSEESIHELFARFTTSMLEYSL